MNQQPTKRFTLDKDQSAVCVVGSCALNGMTAHNMVHVPGVSLPIVHDRELGYLVLDTGTTFTRRHGKQTCIVGYEDLEKLDVDHDNKEIRFQIDRAHVVKVRGPQPVLDADYRT